MDGGGGLGAPTTSLTAAGFYQIAAQGFSDVGTVLVDYLHRVLKFGGDASLDQLLQSAGTVAGAGAPTRFLLSLVDGATH